MSLFLIILGRPNSPRKPKAVLKFPEEWCKKQNVKTFKAIQRHLIKRLHDDDLYEVSLNGDSLEGIASIWPETLEYLIDLPHELPLEVSTGCLPNTESPDCLADYVVERLLKYIHSRTNEGQEPIAGEKLFETSKSMVLKTTRDTFGPSEVSYAGN